MRGLTFALSTLTLVAPFSPAWAQARQDEASPSAEGPLNDIVVTAQRRSEKVQDTPLSVTALDERLLNDRQIEHTVDIAQSVPGLYINNISASPSSLVVFLRGAGEQTGGLATAESPVGIYVDDVYLARLANGNLDLADVERIEVLRGPQGTLYGRNTMTGALKIVTHRPDDTLWARAEVGYGSFDQVRAKAAISGPLADGVAGLVSGYVSNRDGYFDNLGVDPRRGSRRTYGGRVALATTGAGPVQAKVSAFLSDDRNDGLTPVPVNPSAPYQSLTGDFYTTRSPVAAYGRNRQAGVTGDVSVKLGDATLKAISGYIDSRDRWGLDFSGGFNNGGGIVAGFFRQSDTRQHQFSQEVQLQGKAFDDRLDYIGGGYFFTETANQTLNDSFGTGVFGPFPVTLLPTSFRISTRSYAGFGQVDYKLTARVSLTAGLRYTIENKDFSGTIQNGLAAFPPVLSSLIRTKLDENSWTPKFGVNVKANADTLLYATISKGFKAGGFNGLAVADPTILGAPYGAEKVWAYEAGIKTELLGRRLRINADYFYNDLQDIQQNVIVGGGSTRTENAARASLQGLEVEASAVPVSHLTLFGSFSLNWDKYKSLVAASTVAAAGATRLPLVSRLQSQLGASYRLPLAAGGSGAVLLNGDWSHRSSRYSDALDTGVGFIGPVDRVNGSIGYETAGGRWSLSVSARNLLNERDYYSGLALIPGLIAGRYTEEPRSAMVTARYRLGS